MGWQIRLSKLADKKLSKLDRSISARILDELEQISQLDNPRLRGKALQHNLAGLWRYRVGDYRIVCSIEDNVLVVLVVDVEHRRSIYRH